MAESVRFATIPEDLLRVHWQPTNLRLPPYDLGEKGPKPEDLNRFDDPLYEFGVRYLASTLRDSLVEAMSRFRPAPHVEATLSTIIGIQEDESDPTRQDGLQEWLNGQNVGHCSVSIPDPVLS